MVPTHLARHAAFEHLRISLSRESDEGEVLQTPAAKRCAAHRLPILEFIQDLCKLKTRCHADDGQVVARLSMASYDLILARAAEEHRTDVAEMAALMSPTLREKTALVCTLLAMKLLGARVRYQHRNHEEWVPFNRIPAPFLDITRFCPSQRILRRSPSIASRWPVPSSSPRPPPESPLPSKETLMKHEAFVCRSLNWRLHFPMADDLIMTVLEILSCSSDCTPPTPTVGVREHAILLLDLAPWRMLHDDVCPEVLAAAAVLGGVWLLRQDLINAGLRLTEWLSTQLVVDYDASTPPPPQHTQKLVDATRCLIGAFKALPPSGDANPLAARYRYSRRDLRVAHTSDPSTERAWDAEAHRLSSSSQGPGLAPSMPSSSSLIPPPSEWSKLVPVVELDELDGAATSCWHHSTDEKTTEGGLSSDSEEYALSASPSVVDVNEYLNFDVEEDGDEGWGSEDEGVRPMAEDDAEPRFYSGRAPLAPLGASTVPFGCLAGDVGPTF
jgi:hypothetical protein